MASQLLAFQKSLCFANKTHQSPKFVVVEFSANVIIDTWALEIKVYPNYSISNGRSMGNIICVGSSLKP